MDKNEKKKLIPEIDEDLMMSLMVDGVNKGGLQLPIESEKIPIEEKSVPKEKNKVKKNHEMDYEKIFFRKVETSARDGKSVYIRPDFHEKLSRIVQVIGEDKLTIYAYLDNVLEHHFRQFGEQIVISYNEKYKPIL